MSKFPRQACMLQSIPLRKGAGLLTKTENPNNIKSIRLWVQRYLLLNWTGLAFRSFISPEFLQYYKHDVLTLCLKIFLKTFPFN